MREEEMNCKRICELLTAYLDGEVTPEDKAYIEVHLPGCPQCRAELEALTATQENLRGVLKTMAEEAAPSPQAWDKVRSQLETKESRRGFWSVFTPGRVAAATAAVFILVIAVVVWQYGGISETEAPPPTPAPAPAPTPEPEPTPTAPPTVIERPPGPADRPLRVTTVPEEDYYLPGQTIKIGIGFANIGPEAITLSQFPPEIRLLSRAGEMVRLFGARAEELHLEPGATATYNLTWDQQDDSGKQVSPGRYLVDVKNVHYVRGGSPSRAVRANFGDTYAYIQYPQGAMDKVIDLNQSQTVNGITIILERAELSSKGARFCCFVIPPGYTPSQPVPTIMTSAHARYSFDGITRDAGHSGYGTRDNGIKLIWGSLDLPLDPVPSDAQELTFTITRFGDTIGPWEFKIPLE